MNTLWSEWARYLDAEAPHSSTSSGVARSLFLAGFYILLITDIISMHTPLSSEYNTRAVRWHLNSCDPYSSVSIFQSAVEVV